MSNLENLLRYRELLYLFAWRDIRVRYKQSVMGVLWAVFMPALVVGAGVLVRVAASKWSGKPVTPEDLGSVVVRAVAWSFFVSSVRFGTNSLTTNANLVTKIAFPKELFPVSAVLSSLFDFVVAGIVALIVLPLFGLHFTWQALWALPLMVLMVLLATGAALILSALNLFFRDVKYLVEIFLTYAIFFTPVLYPASILGRWQSLVLLNPISPLLEAVSSTLVSGTAPNAFWTSYSALFSAVLLVFSYWLFKQLETAFAERI